MKNIRKVVSLGLILLLAIQLTGCEAVRKKFTRKKKETLNLPRIYQVKKYEKKPSSELYKKHYSYWMSWQSELEKVIGQNHKKDMRCIEEIIGNLKDMRNILVKEKADALQPHIDNLAKAKDILFQGELSKVKEDLVIRTLEREERSIRRDFCYTKMKNYLKKSFDDEPASGT